MTLRIKNIEELMKPRPRTRWLAKARPIRNGAWTTSPARRRWSEMKSRCLNPNDSQWKDYGGRGIKVCDRWRFGKGNKTGFECFVADLGRRPSPKHSLDRYPDNDGDYKPGNVRWATAEQQNRNKRNNTCIIIDGRRVTAVEVAEMYGFRLHSAFYKWLLKTSKNPTSRDIFASVVSLANKMARSKLPSC